MIRAAIACIFRRDGRSRGSYFLRAADFGISGKETQVDPDSNTEVFAQMEPIQLEAGHRVGLGDVSTSVTAKIGPLSEARSGGHFSARYFMPRICHPTMAVPISILPAPAWQEPAS